MADESGALHPIQVLTDELRNEDVQYRLKSISKLSTIALALGPERTCADLIPFIMETVYDEDEVLLVLAEQLGGFISLVGGGNHAHKLLNPLESLACIEETVVRDKAVEVIVKVAASMPKDHLESHYMNLIRRLTNGDWFTNRVSATGLFAVCYSKFSPPTQDDLRALYKRNIDDDTPMVRRAAAGNFAEFCGAVLDTKTFSQENEQLVMSEMLEMLKMQISDEQDGVRLLAVPTLLAFLNKNKSTQTISTIYSFFHLLAEDKSWRVRREVAGVYSQLMVKFFNILGNDTHMESEVLQLYIQLLKDVEGEVRVRATENLGTFCTQWPEATRKQITYDTMFPLMKNLLTDIHEQVKTNLASILVDITKILGKDISINEVMPILMVQLKDDLPDVRQNIISNLAGFEKIIGMDILIGSVLPVIIELATEAKPPKWRVRFTIIEILPNLAKELGKETFDQRLSEICLGCLTDNVFSIREAACHCIAKLVVQFGIDWMKSTVIPKMNELVANGCYLKRITALCLMNSIICHEEKSRTILLPVIHVLTKDDVPNVRFNCAKVYGSIHNQLHSADKSEVKLNLDTMKKDSDSDVSFYAAQAYTILGY